MTLNGISKVVVPAMVALAVVAAASTQAQARDHRGDHRDRDVVVVNSGYYRSAPVYTSYQSGYTCYPAPRHCSTVRYVETPRPVYYAPPVTYYPRPVYVYQPAPRPVYVAPRPVYVAPRPVYYGSGFSLNIRIDD